MPGRNTEEKKLLKIVVVFKVPWEKAFRLITQFKTYQSRINSVLPPRAGRWRSFSLTRVACELWNL